MKKIIVTIIALATLMAMLTASASAVSLREPPIASHREIAVSTISSPAG